MRVFLLIFFFSFNLLAQDIESLFPTNHPSRSNLYNQLLNPIQQSMRQWQRDGIFERKDNCQFWQHFEPNKVKKTIICLRINNGSHFLSFSSDDLKEVFKFTFSSNQDWTIEELLDFDISLMSKSLTHFSSFRTGLQVDYKDGLLRFRTKIFGGFEFFSSTIKWNKDGLRQEVYGRCSFCSAKRYRAYRYSNGRIDYRSSSEAGAISPRDWEGFLDMAYSSVLSELAGQLNFLGAGPEGKM